MFATIVRYVGKKPKPKMKPIELKTPPEQTQTITRVIFDIVKEHGPLTIADTWERVKVTACCFLILSAFVEYIIICVASISSGISKDVLFGFCFRIHLKMAAFGLCMLQGFFFVGM